MVSELVLKPKKQVFLDDILEHIARSSYDYYHGFGPTTWVIDVVPFLDRLAEKLNITKEELGKLLDEAQQRIHNA